MLLRSGFTGVLLHTYIYLIFYSYYNVSKIKEWAKYIILGIFPYRD